MQTPDKKKQMFLDMQEHPEKYSEEQIEAMIDDLDQIPDVESAWQDFNENHPHTALHSSPRWLQILCRAKRLSRAAASIIGVIMISGIAFATIHIVRQYQKPQQPIIKTVTATNPQPSALDSQKDETDTISVEPRIFDNVPLDKMLIEMAGYYGVAVEFHLEEARQLRLHFVWDHNESLDQLVDRLNNFEAVNIIYEPEKLIVK